MLEFFENNWQYIIYAVEILISFIIGIVLFKRTGNIKYLKELSEKMKITYKTEQSPVEHKEIDFPVTKTTYRFNNVTGELEIDEEEFNFQEQIQSCVDQSLDRILARLMPDGVLNAEAFSGLQNTDPVVDGLYDTKQDLMDAQDYLNSVAQERSRLAEKFGWTADLGVSFDDFLSNKKSEIEKTIKDMTAPKPKGVDENAQK